MAHILWKYIFISLRAALGRNPTKEEYDKAISAIQAYDSDTFDVVTKLEFYKNGS